MSVREHTGATAFSVLVLLALVAGCVSAGIGDAGYSGGRIYTNITNTGEPSGGYVQVTIYQIRDFHQQELTVVSSPVSLKTGENTIFYPVELEPGEYKLYVYLIQNGERQTAVVRNIVV